MDSIREAQLYFEKLIPNVIESRRHLYALRQNFAEYYTPRRIQSMPLEHYALGNDLPNVGYNFCYTLEYALVGLGMTKGSSAYKFGVYYGKTISDSIQRYRFTDKFGSNYKEAFINVKEAILGLISCGAKADIQALIDNPISPMFKGKILSTFFPDRYLNIFSDNHLNYFLTQLNLDTEGLLWESEIIKREELLAFKDRDPTMKKWSVDLFAHFLYNVYPGRPPKEEKLPVNDPLKDIRPPKFPVNPSPAFIDMEIIPGKERGPIVTRDEGNENPDYEGMQKERKLLGNRGEQIVLQMEQERLKKFPRIAENIQKAKYDYLGYDILSFEEDNSPRYIEVKATSAKSGQANFFLSSNELAKALELKNYWIYMVYDILSEKPTVWRIPNPFSPENPLVKRTPITYRVVINGRRK